MRRNLFRIATSLQYHQKQQTSRSFMTTIQKASDFERIDDYENVAKRFFELKETEKDSFSPYLLSNARQSHHLSAYGGIIFAQALAAAENTVDPSLKPHSLHSYFILSVDTNQPIIYKVRRARDGRSFATRTVDAVQNGKVAFVFQASFHVEENDSILHQSEMPEVPAPETLMSMRDAVPYIKNRLNKGEITLAPAMLDRLNNYDTAVYSGDTDLLEVRCTNLGNHYGFNSDKKPHAYFWMRARGDLGDDEKLHRYLIAYMTDTTILGTGFSPHYCQNFVPSLITSLDHCAWFHKPNIRVDEWILFETKSYVAGGGRTSIDGTFWRRDGTLIASVHQEALVRSKGATSSL